MAIRALDLLSLISLPVDLLKLDGLWPRGRCGHELVASVASVSRGRDPLEVFHLNSLQHRADFGRRRPG